MPFATPGRKLWEDERNARQMAMGGVAQQQAAQDRAQSTLEAFSRGTNMPSNIKRMAENTANSGREVSRSPEGAPQWGDDFNALARYYGVQSPFQAAPAGAPMAEQPTMQPPMTMQTAPAPVTAASPAGPRRTRAYGPSSPFRMSR